MRKFLWLTPWLVFQAWAADPPQPGQLANTMQAAPLSVGGKFKTDVTQSLGFRGLLGAALGASIGQATNTPGEWGQGAGAYGQRFASSLGGSLSRQTFAFVLETALHEDPRYFPSTEHTKKARIWNVVKQSFMTKTDAGGSRFAYASVISAFGAGQLVNTWQPKSNSHVSDGIERGFISLGLDAATNLVQEFVPRLRPHELRQK
ncbi:MAG TPA: hypothetical protein VK493_05700, partial [Bryobacteraceae bacterium]|nr:hypothetical protein [Bryobacteraceae bacterium]